LFADEEKEETSVNMGGDGDVRMDSAEGTVETEGQAGEGKLGGKSILRSPTIGAKTPTIDVGTPQSPAKRAKIDVSKNTTKRFNKSAAATEHPRKYKGVFEFSRQCKHGEDPATATYNSLGEMVFILRKVDERAGIMPLDDKAGLQPIINKQSIPKSHIEMSQYISWDSDSSNFISPIRKDRDRRIQGTFLLACDMEPRELMSKASVDISRLQLRIYWKALQIVETIKSAMFFNVHIDLAPEPIAETLYTKLRQVEVEMITDGKQDALYADEEFPEITLRKSYAKNSWDGMQRAGKNEEYTDEMRQRNEARQVFHLECATTEFERVDAVAQRAQRLGVFEELLGPFAYYYKGLPDRAGLSTKERYKRSIKNHTCYNLSVGKIALNHVMSLDTPVTIEYEPDDDGITRPSETRTACQEFGKIKVGKIRVFQAIFPGESGGYEAVVPIQPKAQAGATKVCRHTAGYFYNLWKMKAWTKTSIEQMMKATFHAYAVADAEECEWDEVLMQITPKKVSDFDRKFGAMEKSGFVNMNAADPPALVQPSAGHVPHTSMLAFNHEEGGSVTTMRSGKGELSTSTRKSKRRKGSASVTNVVVTETDMVEDDEVDDATLGSVSTKSAFDIEGLSEIVGDIEKMEEGSDLSNSDNSEMEFSTYDRRAMRRPTPEPNLADLLAAEAGEDDDEQLRRLEQLAASIKARKEHRDRMSLLPPSDSPPLGDGTGQVSAHATGDATETINTMRAADTG